MVHAFRYKYKRRVSPAAQLGDSVAVNSLEGRIRRALWMRHRESLFRTAQLMPFARANGFGQTDVSMVHAQMVREGILPPIATKKQAVLEDIRRTAGSNGVLKEGDLTLIAGRNTVSTVYVSRLLSANKGKKGTPLETLRFGVRKDRAPMSEAVRIQKALVAFHARRGRYPVLAQIAKRLKVDYNKVYGVYRRLTASKSAAGQ